MRPTAGAGTATLAKGEFRVTTAELGPGGLLTAEAADGPDKIRLEVFPACSGAKIESRRLFERGDREVHHVYPESAGRD